MYLREGGQESVECIDLSEDRDERRGISRLADVLLLPSQGNSAPWSYEGAMGVVFGILNLKHKGELMSIPLITLRVMMASYT